MGLWSLNTLTSADIISSFECFGSAASAMPKMFHANFDQKLISGAALRWIYTNHSKIIAAP
jgi:hypothetical protein